jgi:flagella basal body P-ring formation protein FlgA
MAMDMKYNADGSAVLRLAGFWFRVFVLVMALTFGLMFIVLGGRAAFAASLKPISLVRGTSLVLGDVFDGLPADKAAYVLGPAPAPGKDLVLNARTLLRIAVALELPWRPESATDQVILRREATVVGPKIIEEAIAAKLREKGVSDTFTVKFSGVAPQMVLPASALPGVEVGQVDFDPAHDLFRATISAPAGISGVAPIAVAGSIEHMTSVPVVNRALRAGDIISAADIDWAEIPSGLVQADFLLSAEDVIGKTPRRSVAQGKPLRDTELIQPRMVSRGDTVTILYESGPVSLTALGKALEDGARGERIRITNISSNRTITGLVSDTKLVRVGDADAPETQTN